MVLKRGLVRWGSTKDRDLIEGIDSLLKVLRLGRTTASKSLATFCAAWVSVPLQLSDEFMTCAYLDPQYNSDLSLTLSALVLDFAQPRPPSFCPAYKGPAESFQVAQIAVGLTQLTYTVNDGTSYNDTYTTYGNVNVTDHSCYHMQYLQQGCPWEVTTQSVAHSYGEMNLAFESRTYNDIADVLESKHNYRYYWRPLTGKRQFAYRFNEYNPEDREQVYPFFTNRTITAEAVNCITYNDTGSDGKEPNTFTYTNGTHNGTVAIPNVYLGDLGTTYMYLGHNPPASAPLYSCGDRCLWMWAYKNGGSPEPSAFYQCAVNISAVSNTSAPQHSIPDHMAKKAAASIAVHGTWTGTLQDQDYRSFQFYADGCVIRRTRSLSAVSFVDMCI